MIAVLFRVDKTSYTLSRQQKDREIKMPSRLIEIFEDTRLVEKIKNRLPYLFQLAELESSRAGKTGMEVGSVRERIIVALLIYKFGEANVETNIPITEPEVDVKLFGEPISIKTITGKSFGVMIFLYCAKVTNLSEFTIAPTSSSLGRKAFLRFFQ